MPRVTGTKSTKQTSSILGIAYETEVLIDAGDVVLGLDAYAPTKSVVISKSDFEALEKRIKGLQEKVQRLEQQAQQVQKS